MKTFFIILWTFNIFIWLISALISINNKSKESLRLTSISASLVSVFFSLMFLIETIK
ncbi:MULTISPECIES: hypothetical protein [unclassified Clostridium]|uniref:hypothetical protein n=1 Tax=unclassified Clostridium TaxID=2614128 RepID=UPI00207AD105|nr:MULTISPECIES: hypothetical protein [unclassified Clostridium]